MPIHAVTILVGMEERAVWLERLSPASVPKGSQETPARQVCHSTFVSFCLAVGSRIDTVAHQLFAVGVQFYL